MHQSCPKCGSAKIRRSTRRASENSLYHVLRTVYRCRHCGERFWSLRRDLPYLWLAGTAAVVVVGFTVWLFLSAFDNPVASVRHVADESRLVRTLKLAERGTAAAQVDLGLMYREGSGVDPNDAEAVKWFRKAAEQHDPNGQDQLGLMYLQGRGVLQDFQEAMKWFRLAAEQGSADAQYQLGLMYRNGHGTAPDRIKSYIWFNLAAAQGNPNAATARDSIGHTLSHSELVDAQGEARKLQAKARPSPPP